MSRLLVAVVTFCLLRLVAHHYRPREQAWVQDTTTPYQWEGRSEKKLFRTLVATGNIIKPFLFYYAVKLDVNTKHLVNVF